MHQAICPTWISCELCPTWISCELYEIIVSSNLGNY